MKTKMITEMEYYELDELVRKTYQVSKEAYDFLSSEEANSDSDHMFDVTKVRPLMDYEEERLEQFKAGEIYQFITATLLQDMVNNNVLLPAEYIIRVSY